MFFFFFLNQNSKAIVNGTAVIACIGRDISIYIEHIIYELYDSVMLALQTDTLKKCFRAELLSLCLDLWTLFFFFYVSSVFQIKRWTEREQEKGHGVKREDLSIFRIDLLLMVIRAL